MLSAVDKCRPASHTAAASIWRLVARQVSPVIVLNNGSENPPLFCVHPITGGVGSLREFAQLCGSDQLIYGLQVPKEKMNADFARSIEHMAEYYVKNIIEICPDGPIAIGGYSAGAVVMLEIAQQLRKLQRDVPLLVALDGAPCNSGAGLSPRTFSYYWKLACNLPLYLKDDFKVADWSWAGLLRRVQLKYCTLLPQLSSSQTLHAGAVQQQMNAQGWKSDQQSFMGAFYKAMSEYVPEYYAGRVVVYEMQTQSLFHLRQIAAVWKKLSWRTDVVELPGRHEALLSRETLDIVAADLRMRFKTLRPQPEASFFELNEVAG